MIQIGTKIWVTNNLQGDTRQKDTLDTVIHYDGERVSKVSYLRMLWDAKDSTNKMECQLYAMAGDDLEQIDALCRELAQYGFNVEVQHVPAMQIDEYYMVDGQVVKEEHPCGQGTGQ